MNKNSKKASSKRNTHDLMNASMKMMVREFIINNKGAIQAAFLDAKPREQLSFYSKLLNFVCSKQTSSNDNDEWLDDMVKSVSTDVECDGLESATTPNTETEHDNEDCDDTCEQDEAVSAPQQDPTEPTQQEIPPVVHQPSPNPPKQAYKPTIPKNITTNRQPFYLPVLSRHRKRH